MKILSRYVFREILTSSFLATALATFVIFLKGIGKLFELLVHSAKGPAIIELFVSGAAADPVTQHSFWRAGRHSGGSGTPLQRQRNHCHAFRRSLFADCGGARSGVRISRRAGLGRLRDMAEPAGHQGGIQNSQCPGRGQDNSECGAARVRGKLHHRQHGPLCG